MLLRPTSPPFDVISGKNVGTPSSEVTGLFCRIPLLWFSCHVLAFSARGTCTGSRYDLTTRFLHSFQGLMDSAHFHSLNRCSSQRNFSVLVCLNTPRLEVLGLSANVKCKLVLPRAVVRHTNINAFPFPQIAFTHRVRIGLLLVD